LKAFILLTLLLLCLGIGLSLYQHEIAHVMINSKAGINSHVDFFAYNGMPAIATIRDTDQTKDLSNLELAHSFNESIGYNLTPLLAGIMGILIIGFMAILNKMEVKNK